MGSALLGSGGGGSISTGRNFIKIILQQKRKVELVDKPSDEFGFVLADIGAVSAEESQQELAIYHAFDRLNDYCKAVYKKQCKCVFPVETGPENTFAPILLAAKKGLDVYDGDGAGRAVPQIQLCSYASAGIQPSPAAITNDKNDSMLVFCDDPAGLDALLRPVTAAPQFGNSASLAFFPAPLKNLAKACVYGSISYALYTGMLLKALAQKDGERMKEAMTVVNKKEACLLCSGKVISVTDQVQGAFDIGSVTIKTKKGDLITIYNQNENLIAFSSGQSAPLAVAPHSICYVRRFLQPITNAEIKKDDEVSVLCIKAVPQLMKPFVLKGFQKLLNGLGYGGKAAGIQSENPLMPLGKLLQSLSEGEHRRK